MDHLDDRRGNGPDLLVRPPCAGRAYEEGWAAVFVDPTDQLKTLAELLAQGLLSAEEFERQKAKVIDPWR